MAHGKKHDLPAEPRKLARIVCRKCDTLIYPRHSPAGPMAMICECARPQIEAALANLPGLRVEYAH